MISNLYLPDFLFFIIYIKQPSVINSGSCCLLKSSTELICKMKNVYIRQWVPNRTDFFCLFFNKFIFFNLFIYLFLLCWVFVSVRGLSLVTASGGHSSSRYTDLSLSRPLLLRSTGSRRAGSVVVAHGPSCSAVCGSPRPGLEPMYPALAGRL